jgi:hypothetical protein
MNKLTDFAKGIIAGFIFAIIIFFIVAGLVRFHNRERTFSTKEIIEYAERQIEIEILREEIINRDPAVFLDDLPGARRAADGAAAEFERKRDEALHRFRSRMAD